MDFTHTDTRRMLADTIERYLRDKYPLAPRVEAGNTAPGFQPAHYEGLAELGVIAALFPEDQGGFGGDGFDIAVVFEELGKRLVNEPVLDNALVPGPILAAAGKTDAVEEIIAGAARYALAAEEPQALYDLGEVETKAVKSGDGYALSGTKSVVKYASGCAGFIVSARTDAGGIALFLVAPDAVELRDYTTVDGGQASEITLDDAPGELLVEDGAAALDAASGRAALALSAEALGIMATIREMTIDYLRQRKQFGVPIGKFQALQHRMAEMLLEIEQARSAVINAAAALEKPQPERDRILAATKYSIGRIGRLVAEESIQMHGGIGMTWEYDLGHFAKRLILIDHEWGDQDFHLARFIELGRVA